MYLNSNTNILFDAEMTKSIIALCELSGLEIPDVIDSHYINSVSKRLKDVMFSLKEQGECQKERSQKYKKKFETLQTSYLLSSRISNRMIEELKNKANKFKLELKKINDAPPSKKNTSNNTYKDLEEEKNIISTNLNNNNESISPETENKTYEIQPQETPEYKQENVFQLETNRLSKQIKQSSEKKNSMGPQAIQNAMVIGKIGLILHQVKLTLSKFGCNVEIAKNDYEAISEIKNKNFQCIVIDIKEISEDDFSIIDIVKKATNICGKETTIVALVQSIKEKKIAKELKIRGAEVIIEKTDGWQNTLANELNLNCWQNDNKLSILK